MPFIYVGVPVQARTQFTSLLRRPYRKNEKAKLTRNIATPQYTGDSWS